MLLTFRAVPVPEGELGRGLLQRLGQAAGLPGCSFGGPGRRAPWRGARTLGRRTGPPHACCGTPRRAGRRAGPSRTSWAPRRPQHIREASSLSGFKGLVKTHLFSLAFNTQEDINMNLSFYLYLNLLSYLFYLFIFFLFILFYYFTVLNMLSR